LLPAPAALSLRRWNGGEFRVLCKGSAILIGSLSAADRLWLLPKVARQAVPMQTESREHNSLVVFSDCCPCLHFISTGHSKHLGQSVGRLK